MLARMECGCVHVASAPLGPERPVCTPVAQTQSQALGAFESPLVVYRLLGERAERLKNERAWMLLLRDDKFLHVCSEIGRGTREHVLVDLDWALACALSPVRTPYCILAHNHPSGSSWPSAEDMRLTVEMGRAAARQGLELLDHVVLGHGELFSFYNRQGFRL
jgi:DNA repair protein RadC